VKEIRWRSTLLETRNWDTLIVPNSVMLGEQIQILGQKEDHPRQHREWIYFHVDYRYAPEEVMRAVDDALQSAPILRVANDPPASCLCIALSTQEETQGTVTYGVRYWLTDQGIHDSTNSAVRVRIFAALKRAQIPLALPGAALFLSNDDKEHQERKEARELATRVSALEAIEMLQCLSPEERLELARKMRLAPFSRGEVITRQGAVAHWLYVLAKGEAEVRIKVARGAGPNGASQPALEKLVARLTAPDVFGEMGVMTGEPRTATVSAATDVECYRIDRETFHALVKARHELADSISAVLARRRVELQAVRDNLGPEDKQGRVAVERRRILAGIQSFFGLDDEES
jgi:CRP-like cAMP-binding protein